MSFKVQYISDSMLKNMIGEFDHLKYDNTISMCCFPGADISQVPVLLANNCEKPIDLLIVNCGVNNIINGYSVNNCMYLYEKTHHSIKLAHPNSIVAFTSISFIAENNFNDIDMSVDINPLISELNEALESYCLLKESTEFIDLRPYLSVNGDTSNIERTNLARDGLHYSKRGTKMVAKALINETDKLMASKLDTQKEQDFKVDDTWPDLPNPTVKARIRPAQYPGQQFLECRPDGRFITENKMSVQKETVAKPVSFTSKTILTEKTRRNKKCDIHKGLRQNHIQNQARNVILLQILMGIKHATELISMSSKCHCRTNFNVLKQNRVPE